LVRKVLIAVAVIAAASTALIATLTGGKPASAAVPRLRLPSGQSASVYSASTVPAVVSENDPQAAELGVRFKVYVAGTVTRVRYYKSAANVGPHTGSVWSPSGVRLATVTFSGESRQGWQTATFAKPVTVVPGGTYTASYHTNSGHYAQQIGAFDGGKTLGTGYVRATAGVYRYGASGYPTSSWKNSAYYVDVSFAWTPPVFNGPVQGGPTPATPAPSSAIPTTSAPAPSTSSAVPSTSSSPAPPPATNPAPASGGKFNSPPTAGVPTGTVLTRYTGPSTITKDGTVIDAKDISTGLEIAAHNVVITRSEFHTGTDNEAIHVSGSASISDTTITGGMNGIGGDNYTATRVEVTMLTDDGFKLGDNVHIDQAWCHNMTPSPAAHADCGQMQAGVVNLSVTNSWLDGGRNSALFLAPDLGPSTNGPVRIDNNVLGNGNYTLYCVDGNNGQYLVKNITITNNRFLRGAQYGPVSLNVPVTAGGNTWFDTGAAVSVN
jgi:hypothetical protein